VLGLVATQREGGAGDAHGQRLAATGSGGGHPHLLARHEADLEQAQHELAIVTVIADRHQHAQHAAALARTQGGQRRGGLWGFGIRHTRALPIAVGK
jgi:hypothetical protein